MTVLQRTNLTTSQKIQCAAAAVAGQHAHGSKTALSETYEISRPTVYAVGAAAQSVLRSHFESPLLQGAAVDVRVDDAQLRRAVPLAARARLVVALRVLAPNAIRPIEDLVPLLYPGVKVSYGTIQQMLVEAEGRAARFNAQVSLGGVEAGALDEMFSQGEPVLPLSWGCEPLDSARCTMRSCRLGLTALDVAEQLVAGRVDESCGGEVVERHSDAVELLEGDTGAKIALGSIERLQLQVRRSAVLEGVALPRASLAIGGLDGEVAGTMVVQIRRQHVAQEDVDEDGVTARDVGVAEMAAYH